MVFGVLLLMLTTYGIGRADVGRTSVAADGDCQTFTQTGHQVCGAFLTYWTANGGLAQQGYPVSDPLSEKSDTDGKTYTVQYFERAVFEMHPELPAGSNVLLTLLGAQKYKAKYSAPQSGSVPATVGAAPVPTATIAPAATSTPVAATATAKPAPMMAPASLSPAGDDTAYQTYLAQKFANVGSHKIDLKGVTITRAGSGSSASVIVSFQVELQDGATYFADSAPKSDLQAWGTALLADLKAKYPNTYVVGTLQQGFYSDTYDGGGSTDCTYQSDSYTSGQGWYTVLYFVKVSYIPSGGGDKVKACFGK